MSPSQKPIFTFTWQFHNFSMCPLGHSEVVCSPAFAVKLLGHSEWQLMFYPKGIEKHENSLSFYLLCRSSGTNKRNVIQIDFAITIHSDDSKRRVTKETGNKIFQKKDKCGFSDFMSMKDLCDNKEAYLANDTLTIECTMWPSDVSAGDSSSAFTDQAIATGIELNAQLTGEWNDCSATTRFEVQNKNISWAIKNFNSISFGERLSIPVNSAIKGAPSFRITLYKSIANQCVEIEIQRDSKSVSRQFFFKCKASVFHVPKGAEYVTEDVHLFLAEVDDVWMLPSFIQLEKLQEDKYLNNTSNILHLRFEFSYSGIDDVYYIETVSLRQYGTFLTFSEPIEEFRHLYKVGEVYDVVIRVGDRRFKVLKSLLGARSPVFRARFDSEMKEKERTKERIMEFLYCHTLFEAEDILDQCPGAVKDITEAYVMDVSDVDAETLDRMLTFIYSNALEDMQSEDALKLYTAADKYKVLSLKFRCSWILANCISVSNVCEILILADRHGDDYLRDCAESFIRANSMEVLKSLDWTDLIKDYGTLAANVMLRMLTC